MADEPRKTEAFDPVLAQLIFGFDAGDTATAYDRLERQGDALAESLRRIENEALCEAPQLLVAIGGARRDFEAYRARALGIARPSP
jgi:hypothetical protein